MILRASVHNHSKWPPILYEPAANAELCSWQNGHVILASFHAISNHFSFFKIFMIMFKLLSSYIFCKCPSLSPAKFEGISVPSLKALLHGCPLAWPLKLQLLPTLGAKESVPV